MKIRNLLSAVLVFSFMNPSFSSLSASPSVDKKYAPRRNLQAALDGFDLETVTPLYTPISNKTGYVHVQSGIYSLKLNTISSLVLVRTSISFTPGFVAAYNDEKGFDPSSLFLGGYVHLWFSRFYCSDAHGDEVRHIAAFPRSTEATTIISKSFSKSVNVGKTVSGQLSISGNSSLTYQNTNSGGLSFTYQNETSTTAEDPTISYQNGADGTEAQWSFQVRNTEIAGKVTYWFDCVNLLEVKNEDIDSVPNNSFEMDASFKFETTAGTTNCGPTIVYQYC